MVGYEVDRTNPERRDGIAPVHALAEAEEPARSRDFRAAFERLGAHDGRQHFELRQFDPEIAAEQAAPRAAGEDHGLTGDAPLLGDHRRNPPALGFDTAHRALGHYRGAVPPRCFGYRRRRPLRLGLAVAGGVERASPVSGQAGHQLGRFGAAEDAAVQLILSGVLEPGFKLRELWLGLRQIHDPGLAKPGLGFDHLVHALPEPEALDDQRQFARIAAHLATPAPIAARLLAGDVALFAE